MNLYTCINGWTREKMIEHIKKEFKGKSVDNSGDVCLYRGTQGRKCAVGMFIPDHRYLSEMDTRNCNGVQSVVSSFGLGDLMPLAGPGLSRIQEVHDSATKAACLSDILVWIENNVVGSP